MGSDAAVTMNPAPMRGGVKESYRVSDLDGCEVLSEEGELLGVLVDVLPSGGNDIFVVRRGEREILIPALKQVVRMIDLRQRQMRVSLPAGLREIYAPTT